MMIHVIRTDGTFDKVRASTFGAALKSGGISAYLCSEGWIDVNRENDQLERFQLAPQESRLWEIPMHRPVSLRDGLVERLKVLLKQAKSKTEFQRIQAVYLRAATAMTPDEIAAALAMHPGTVRHVHSAFLRSGEKAFNVSPRGGRQKKNPVVAADEAV